MSGWFSLLSYFVGIFELYANSVDHNRIPCSAASELGLHCLRMSVLWYAGLELVDEVNSGLDQMSLHVLPGPGSLVMRTLPGLTYLLCTQRLVR